MLPALSVTKGGEDQTLGNMRAVLYALIMADRDGVSKGALRQLQHPGNQVPGKPRDDAHALRMAFLACRELGLKVDGRVDPVRIARPLENHVSIDLWSFFDHVDNGEFAAAEELFDGDLEIVPPEPRLAEFTYVWEDTLTRLATAGEALRVGLHADVFRRRTIAETSERMLSLTASAGIGPDVPLRDVRDEIDGLQLPWQAVRPDGDIEEAGLVDYLADKLGRPKPSPRQRLILIGGSGSGKTLVSRLTYLRLGERALADPGEAPVLLYFDASEAGEDFGTEDWWARVVAEAGGAGERRPIVIVSQADALFADESVRASEVFSRPLFCECDTLICCSEHVYANRLGNEGFGRGVIRVRPLGRELQGCCAAIMFDSATREKFEAWRGDDKALEALCGVPLHLAYALDFVTDDPEVLKRISTHWHLFDQVALMRIERGGATEDVAERRFEELAAVAHHFYRSESEGPIGFSRRRLSTFLRKRDAADVRARAEALIKGTLLVPPEPASNEIHFETASWDRFFVASHLSAAVLQDSPDDLMKTFAKFFSAEVMDLCESMLREELGAHGVEIHAALRSALFDGLAPIKKTSRRTARMQIAYLLAKLEDADGRQELQELLDPDSSSAEEDVYVRLAIVYGLANGGEDAVADRQIERFKQERASSPEVSERDANVHLALSFRGRVKFDPGDFTGREGDVEVGSAVRQQLRLLGDESYRGSWRLRLYTLREIAEHPAVKGSSFLGAIASERENGLIELLQGLEADPQARAWGELGKLRQIVGQ